MEEPRPSSAPRALGVTFSMAKGYPTRELDVEHPVLDDVLAEDVCRVCKHRPAVTPHGLCATCHTALHPEQAARATRA